MFNRHALGQRGETLALLWLFAILNTLFRDIHEMVEASTITDILNGHMNGAPVSEGALLAGAFGVELLLLAFLLSWLLSPVWARRLNLVLVPMAGAGMFIVPPADPDDFVFTAVVLATFVTIFMLAWRWHPDRSDVAASAVVGGQHAA